MWFRVWSEVIMNEHSSMIHVTVTCAKKLRPHFNVSHSKGVIIWNMYVIKTSLKVGMIANCITHRGILVITARYHIQLWYTCTSYLSIQKVKYVYMYSIQTAALYNIDFLCIRFSRTLWDIFGPFHKAAQCLGQSMLDLSTVWASPVDPRFS